jgi:antitoxin YefM
MGAAPHNSNDNILYMYYYSNYSTREKTMDTISYTAARAHLAQTMQQICEDHTPMIITRSGSEPVVMMSLSDFKEIQETHYLMKNPANASRLAKAIDEIEAMIARDKKK